MSIEFCPDFAMEYSHPVLSLVDHGKELALSGADPEEIEAFAYQASAERNYNTVDRLAIRGMAAEVHRNYTNGQLYLPGTEFLK